MLHTLPVLYIFDVKYNYLADAVCARGNLLKYITQRTKERRPTAHHSIKMNLYSVLLNDSFALYDAVCAIPLEQFQILPLSAQVYPSSAGISSLEMSNLFPQVGGSSEFVYFTSGAGLGASAASLTS